MNRLPTILCQRRNTNCKLLIDQQYKTNKTNKNDEYLQTTTAQVSKKLDELYARLDKKN